MTGELLGKTGEPNYHKAIDSFVGQDREFTVVSGVTTSDLYSTVTQASLGRWKLRKKGSGKGIFTRDHSRQATADAEVNIEVEGYHGRLSKDRTKAYFQAIPSREHESPNAQMGEIIVSSVATTPRTFFTPQAEFYAGRFSADTLSIQQKLLRLGFDEQLAQSFAVVFFNETEVAHFKNLEPHAFYRKDGVLDVNQAGSTYYPWAFLIGCRENEEQVNTSFWHEVGHGHDDKVLGTKSRDSWYVNPTVIQRTKLTGLATEIGGTLVGAGSTVYALAESNLLGLAGLGAGALLYAAGATMNITPALVLGKLDPHERYANRFARQHSHIRAIHIKE